MSSKKAQSAEVSNYKKEVEGEMPSGRSFKIHHHWNWSVEGIQLPDQI